MSIIAATVANTVGAGVSPADFSLEPREPDASDDVMEQLKAALGAVESP